MHLNRGVHLNSHCGNLFRPLVKDFRYASINQRDEGLHERLYHLHFFLKKSEKVNSKYPLYCVCRILSFSYVIHPDVQNISQGTWSTLLHDTMTTVGHSFASRRQRQSQHCLQNWSLRHIGSVCSVDPDYPVSFTAVLKRKHSIFSLPNYRSWIQLYLHLNHCIGPLPMVTPEAISTQRALLQVVALAFWFSLCCWWTSSFLHLPHSSAAHFFTVLLQQGLPRCYMQEEISEDLRGIVAFPLSESHSCATCPAAHAPLTPHAPVSINMFRDGSFTDTLPSSAPLKCNCVSRVWKGALDLANNPVLVDFKRMSQRLYAHV